MCEMRPPHALPNGPWARPTLLWEGSNTHWGMTDSGQTDGNGPTAQVGKPMEPYVPVSPVSSVEHKLPTTESTGTASQHLAPTKENETTTT